jgi:glycosyltransferase involved in cell wall biosynthesis
MKIGFFIPRYYPVHGGTEEYVQQMAEYCISQSDSVHIHTTTAYDLQSFISSGYGQLSSGEKIINGICVSRHKVSCIRLRRYWGNLPYRLNLLPQKYKGYVNPATPVVPSLLKLNQDFDLIHSGPLPYDFVNLAAMRLAKKNNIPFVITPSLHLGDLDDPDDPIRPYYTQPYQIDLINRAEGCIVQSNIEKRFLLEKGISKDKLHLVVQGINCDDLEYYAPEIFRKKHDIPMDAFVIGHLGNLSFEKGSIDLHRTFTRLRKKYRDIYLVYAGATMNSWKKYISSCRNDSNFRHMGVINHKTKEEFFSSIDCFCLPSRVEAFGIVFLEAWRYKKPVLGYKTGGVPDVIDNGKNGFVVKAGNLDELAEKMILLYKSRELAQAMGDEGYRKLGQRYRLADVNRKRYEILQTLAKNGR